MATTAELCRVERMSGPFGATVRGVDLSRPLAPEVCLQLAGGLRDHHILRIPGHDGYVLATTNGVFEPFHALGAEVHAGEDAGRIHNLADPGRAPETVRYLSDGIVYGRRQPGRVVVGNCCVTVAAPYEGAIA